MSENAAIAHWFWLITRNTRSLGFHVVTLLLHPQ